MEPLYRIREWHKHYENKDSRKLRRLSWLPIPIKLNGTGYRLLMRREDGPAIFGCFLAIAEAAGEIPNVPGESPDRDGTLKRSNGEPHTAETLSAKISMPKSLIEHTLTTLSSGDFDWIERESPDAPGKSPDVPGENPSGRARQGIAAHSSEGKGIEWQGKADESRKPERAGLSVTDPPLDPISEITNALHEATGKPPDPVLGERLCRETAVEGIHPELTRRWIEHKARERKQNPIRLPKLFLDDWPTELRQWIKANLAALNGGRYGLMEAPVCRRCNVQMFLFEDGCVVRCRCKPAKGLAKVAVMP